MKQIITDLETSGANIERMSTNLDQYLTEIRSSKGAVNHLIKDEAFAQNLDTTLLNLKEATELLNENMEALKHNFFFRGYFKKQERLEKKALRDSLRNLGN